MRVKLIYWSWDAAQNSPDDGMQSKRYDPMALTLPKDLQLLKIPKVFLSHQSHLAPLHCDLFGLHHYPTLPLKQDLSFL